jgi:hypothetical protein
VVLLSVLVLDAGGLRGLFDRPKRSKQVSAST